MKLDYVTATESQLITWARSQIRQKCLAQSLGWDVVDELVSNVNYRLAKSKCLSLAGAARFSYASSIVSSVFTDYHRKKKLPTVEFDDYSDDFAQSINPESLTAWGISCLSESIYIDKIWADGVLDELGPRESELFWLCLTHPHTWRKEAKRDGFPEWEIESFHTNISRILIEQGITG